MSPPVRHQNPAGVHDPSAAHYSHIAMADPGSRIVYFSGQIAVDKEGNTPSDLESQTRVALANVKACLADVGATVRNILHMTLYIVDYDAATCPIWPTYIAFLTDDQGTYNPAGTLVPVPALAAPEFKIEIQCVVALRPSEPALVVKPAIPHHPTTATVDVDVVVVGAGLSGLQAAEHVHKAGLTYAVVEARDRVGGKTHSIPMTSGPGVVDVGAAWINNQTQPKMYALFQRFGLEPLVQRSEGDTIFSGGGRRNVRFSTSGDFPLDPHHHRIYQDITAALDSEAAQIHIHDSTANMHLDDISLGEFFRRKGAHGASLALWTVWVRSLTGCEPDNIGLVYFLDYIKSGGGLQSLLTEADEGAQYLRNRQGNQTVSVRLAAQLDPQSIYLKCPVTQITQTGDGCVVETYGGTVFRGRKVVVSVPTPLYRHITFSPALPPEKQEIAGATHLGAYSKCILVYAEPWWRQWGLSGSFCDLDGPIAFSRDVSSDEDAMFAIACFMVGDYAVQWSRLSPSQRTKVVTDQIADMVTQALRDSRTPGDVARADEVWSLVTATVQTIEKQWAPEPWSEGAPCPMVAPGGTWARLGNELRRPHGHVHFVGTETAYEWKGYMEGAVRSGERGAAEVIKALADVGSRPRL